MKDSTLIHYGIKNQKWGVRRFQNPDGTLTPAGKERYDDSPEDREYDRDPNDPANMTYFKSKSAHRGSIKNVSDMSDEELNAHLDRFRREQSYTQYTKTAPSIVDTVSKRVFAKSAETVGTAYVTMYAERGLKAMTETAIAAGKNYGPGVAKKIGDSVTNQIIKSIKIKPLSSH